MNDRIAHAILLGILLGACPIAEGQARAGDIPGEMVAHEVIAHLETAYASSEYDVTFSLPQAQKIGIPGVDSLRLAVTHDPIELPVRSIPVNITVLDQDGEVCRKFRQVARVRMFDQAVVVTGTIDRDERIDREDVALRRVDVTGQKDYFTTLDALDGLQSKKILRQGAVLTSAHVRPAFIVTRGDRVLVEVHDSNIMVRTQGVARQGGSLGEEITVYIDMTRTTVPGVIIDSGTVVTGTTGG